MTTSLPAFRDLLLGPQHNRILRLSFPRNDAPDGQFLVNKLDATECLSMDFVFKVELLADNAKLDLKAMQGKLLSIELVRQDGSLRYFSGYVFSFRCCRSDGGITFYEAVLGPWLKFLSLRKNSVLFHGKNLRDQADAIFRDYGALARYDWRVTGDDHVMTQACQFNESDFNYLSRRWEAAGWYYWYEHDATGHTLVVSGNSTLAAPIDGGKDVRFHSAGNAVEEDAIDHWSPVRHVTPSSVALGSFNFKGPRPVHVDIPTFNHQANVPALEAYEYAGNYGFRSLPDGDAQSHMHWQDDSLAAWPQLQQHRHQDARAADCHRGRASGPGHHPHGSIWPGAGTVSLGPKRQQR